MGNQSRGTCTCYCSEVNHGLFLNVLVIKQIKGSYALISIIIVIFIV